MRIMLNGRAGAGKDEIAKYLVENHNFIQLSFATPIYKIAREVFGMEQKDRELLQYIGQTFRERDRDVWVKCLFNNLPNGNIVISDCRQLNEVRMGEKHGFTPIRVVATLENRVNRIILRDGFPPDLSLLENDSETGADSFPYIDIGNDGTKKELYEKIDNLVYYLSMNEHIDNL